MVQRELPGALYDSSVDCRVVYLDPLTSSPTAPSFAALRSAEHRAKFDFGAAFSLREVQQAGIRHEQQDNDVSLGRMMFAKNTHPELVSNGRLTSSSLDRLQKSTFLHAALQDESGTESGSHRGAGGADRRDLDNSKATNVSSSWERAKVCRNQFDSSAAFCKKKTRSNVGEMQKKGLSMMKLLFGNR